MLTEYDYKADALKRYKDLEADEPDILLLIKGVVVKESK